MESHKDRVSDGGDPEDIPSDFFDDFGKEDFMEGLSVIDSWDDDDNTKRRIDAKAIDEVNDLRELIDGGKEDEEYRREDKGRYRNENQNRFKKGYNKYKWVRPDLLEQQQQQQSRFSHDENKLDEFIRPGSRRDPSKTNEAIKKDKEVKVKEILAKQLESSNDELRPPGTELDDYYESKRSERKRTPLMEEPLPPPPRRRSRSREQRQRLRESPMKHRRSPRRSPPARWSPRRNMRHFSPQRKFRRFSPPLRRSPRRFSPMRRSPRRSPRRTRRSRSPVYHRHRSPLHSASPHSRDTFLYPNLDPSYPSTPVGMPYTEGPGPSYSGSGEYHGSGASYSYPQGSQYVGGYSAPSYDYGATSQMPVIQQPQPVPAPLMNPAPVPAPTPLMDMVLTPAPTMVPAPASMVSPSPKVSSFSSNETSTPFDALAQLVADGKLSKEDYLKLAPVKKGGTSSVDAKARVMVLTRCDQALSKLSKLLLPNRLVIHRNIFGPEQPKSLAPKYCSPLKRQMPVEFQFTKTYGKTMQQNKQLVDSIIATIGLNKVVSRPKKKMSRDMKDAAVQTTKPFCEVCEIRESTGHREVGTSIEPEHFSASVQTQVVEQDLFSSKSIFNPTGSAVDTTPMSIAHMTPAQLVSQLAARAKTLKQTPDPPSSSNQFSRRNPSYDNRGQYHNNYDNYNYRY